MAFLQNDHIVVDILNAFSMEGIIQYTACLSFNKFLLMFPHIRAHPEVRTFDYLTCTHHANVCLVNFHVCTQTLKYYHCYLEKHCQESVIELRRVCFYDCLVISTQKLINPLNNFEPSSATLIRKYFNENSQYNISQNVQPVRLLVQ